MVSILFSVWLGWRCAAYHLLLSVHGYFSHVKCTGCKNIMVQVTMAVAIGYKVCFTAMYDSFW